jgi:hypothetical protein
MSYAFHTTDQIIRRSPLDAEAITKLHQWRVQTTHFISNLRLHDSRQFAENLGRNMGSKLERLVQRRSPPLTSAQRHEFPRRLLDIILQAVNIDHTLRMSRAYFHVVLNPVDPLGQDHSFPFDDSSMELPVDLSHPRRSNPQPVVDLVIIPGIFKSGNLDGRNYDKISVISKLSVVYHVNRIVDTLSGRGLDHPEEPV